MIRRGSRTTSPGEISREVDRVGRGPSIEAGRDGLPPRPVESPRGASSPGPMKAQFVTPVITQNAFSRTSIESARRIAAMIASFFG